MTDPRDAVTTNVYDEVGDLTSATLASPAPESVPVARAVYTWDAAHRLNTVANSRVVEKDYDYDDRGNLVAVTDAAGAKTSYAYDAANRLTGMTTARGNVAGADQLTKDAYTWEYTYDEVGNLRLVSDPQDRTWETVYDELNRPITVISPLQRAIRYGYDQSGNLISVTTPRTATTTVTTSYGYDRLNREG